MLDQVTVDDFRPYVQGTFRAQLETGDRLELELIDARPLGPALEAQEPNAPRHGFSLIFRGPLGPMLGQGIYPVEHPRLSTLGIFLVPLGPEGDPHGLHYQAISN